MRFGALLILFSWIHYSLNMKPLPTRTLAQEITPLINESQSQVTVEVTQKDGTIQGIGLEDYIIGVVAGEMPLSFEDEALKAQSIASRTFAMSRGLKVDTTTNTQVYLTIDQMKKNWQDQFDEKYERLKNIVYSTHNQVMKYNNQYISALFFASSNGKTENSEDYFASSSVPYLRSVESNWELSICPTIERTSTFTKEDLNNKFGFEVTEMSIQSHFESGRVKEVSVNGTVYTGRAIRELLNLASSDFTIEIENEHYLFHTLGYGHGVGMSQYGANGMALNGSTYDEILKYYYQGIEICNL